MQNPRFPKSMSQHPSLRVRESSDHVGSRNYLITQSAVREMNFSRMQKSEDARVVQLRRSAVSRLHRRRFEADEIDLRYWTQRENTMHLVEYGF
ncbi:MAG: hypothetical protein ACKVKP_02495 [Acidimicrobiales bacterium]|jgi:hypothetical protein